MTLTRAFPGHRPCRGRSRRAACGCAIALLLTLAGCGAGGQPTAKPSCAPATARPAGTASASASPAQCAAVAASPAAGRTWHGTVTSTATVLYHTGGVTSGPYTGSYAGTLALAEDAAGAISGHVRVSASGCHIGGGKPATAINFNVTGTDSEGLLRLQLVITSFRINGTNCGFGDGWYPPQPGISVTQASAGIPVVPPGTARASWTVFAYHPSGKWTVHYQVDLTCTGCGGS